MLKVFLVVIDIAAGQPSPAPQFVAMPSLDVCLETAKKVLQGKNLADGGQHAAGCFVKTEPPRR